MTIWVTINNIVLLYEKLYAINFSTRSKNIYIYMMYFTILFDLVENSAHLASPQGRRILWQG